jgi:hypothetical protein
MTVWTAVGNVKSFQLTPGPVPKEHWSTQIGQRAIDKMAIIQKRAKFEMELDEVTLDNSIMALMGIQSTDGTIDIMGAASVERQVKFDGTNDFGARVEVILPRVFMLCTNPIDLIASNDDWMELKITGEILRDNLLTGHFGSWGFLNTATGSAPLVAPDTLNYTISYGKVYTAPLA